MEHANSKGWASSIGFSLNWLTGNQGGAWFNMPQWAQPQELLKKGCFELCFSNVTDKNFKLAAKDDLLKNKQATSIDKRDGFSILPIENGRSFQPTDPIERNTSASVTTRRNADDINRIGYLLSVKKYEKLDVAPSQDTQPVPVPFIRYNDANYLKDRNLWDYKFNLLPYQAKGDLIANRTYLFTAEPGKEANAVQRNTFFLYQDLEDRLCGSPSTRVELFKKDWLAALAGMKKEALDKLYASKDGGDNLLNRLFTRGLLPDRLELASIRKSLQEAKSDQYHSHFPIWNSAGKLHTPWESAQFLGQLLAPVPNADEDTPSSNLARFIFGRFCKLLYAATVGPDSDWSVEARYWNEPIDTPTLVKFYYYLPPALRQRMDVYPGLTTDHWKDVVKKAHKAVYDEMKTETIKPRFLPDGPDAQFIDNDTGYHKLGSHPQGLYIIYVSDADWVRMQGKPKKIRPVALPYPQAKWTPSDTIKYGALVALQPTVQGGDIWTLVTNDKVRAAKAWGRGGGQNAVMGGASAKEVAKDMLKVDVPDFEWLHRCAFSYGGLKGKDTDPDSAQVPDNLVLGTYEANTTMMRYERYIKRLARRDNVTNGGVFLRTSLKYGNHQPDFFWKAPILRYKWALAKNGTEPATHYRVVDIDLFGRAYPTLFEVRMDKAADDLVYNDASSTGGNLYKAIYESGSNGTGLDADEDIPNI
ncbi:hypothetical protein VNI00_006247 [Paramarasmius palmivorus]|uniref:Uncharacterized protein n=1 Tax=Paramarasmius palmivorus TaxID=297713 RepID=A0AAW0D987_9AGAR